MTRKKDKIKINEENIRIKRNLSNSRLYNREQVITNEVNLLKKIQKLPDELIRIIYNYMSSNPKLFCNFKFDYIESKMKSYELNSNLNIIRNLTKKELIDLINKGVLYKFPDIIENIYNYYYCLDENKHLWVNWNNLFNLWEKNRLFIDIENETDLSEEEKVDQIEWSIKYYTKDSIINYIENQIKLYNINKSRTITQKKWIFNDNTLFCKIDNIYYLYKNIEYLMNRKNI